MNDGPEPRARTASRSRRLLGLAIGLVLAGILLWRIDLGQVRAAIAGVAVWPVALGILCKIVALGLKIVRWRLTLGAALRATPRKLTSATLLGYFVNAILPAKLGDLARIRLAARTNQASFAQVLGSLTLERSFDGFAVLALLAGAVATLALPSWARVGSHVGVALALVLLVALVALARRRTGFDRPGWRWFPARFRVVFERFASGLAALQSPVLMLAATLLTLLAWACEVLGVYLVLSGFQLQLSWTVALTLTTVVSLGLAAPSAPAGLGVHQALYLACLLPYHVPSSVAVAASVLQVGLMLVVLAALAALSLLLQGISLASLIRSDPRESPRPESEAPSP
jgi:uncharacterized protein (TIRG00374 family)